MSRNVSRREGGVVDLLESILRGTADLSGALCVDHPETSGSLGFPGSPGYSPSSKPEGAVQSGSPGTTSGKVSDQHKRDGRKPDTPDKPSEPDQMAIPSEAGSEPIQMSTCKLCGRPCKPTIAAHVECLMRRAS